MRRDHFTYCLIGVAAGAILLVVGGVRADTLAVLAVALACPLMMLLMNRGKAGGHSRPQQTFDQVLRDRHARGEIDDEDERRRRVPRAGGRLDP